MGRCQPLDSLNPFLSLHLDYLGPNSVSLFTLRSGRCGRWLIRAFPQLLSSHCRDWRHLLNLTLVSLHSYLKARNPCWLWHFLFIDMSGDILIPHRTLLRSCRKVFSITLNYRSSTTSGMWFENEPLTKLMPSFWWCTKEALVYRFGNNSVNVFLLTSKGCYFRLLLLLLSCFSHVRLCATPWTAAYQASLSMGFSRQEHWSGLPFPSPMHESGKWKWSLSVVSVS